ncbi:MAG: redoxin domain-containing protein [Brachymonas sp.]
MALPSSLKQSRWWLRQLGFFCTLALIVQGAAWWQARSVVRGTAPTFALPLALAVQGQNTISLDAFRTQHAGRPVLLYFWAEWCPVCKVQQSSLNSLMPEFPVLTIATQSGDAAAVQKVLIVRQLPWLTAVDQQGALWRSYGLRGVPTTIVLDAQGQISSVSVGYTSAWSLRLKLWWAAR